MNPDQSRLQFPYPRPRTEGDHDANIERLRHWTDRIPVFPPYQGYLGDATGDSTTSAGYVTLAVDGNPFTFYKDESWTDLRVDMRVSCYVTGGTASESAFAVQIDSETPFIVCRHLHNSVDHHHAFSGIVRRGVNGAAPLRAGEHTVTVMWARTSGTSTLMFDTNDYLHCEVLEVIPPRTR